MRRFALAAALAACALAVPAAGATVCRPDPGQSLRFAAAADLRAAPGPDQRAVSRARAGARLRFAGQVAHLTETCRRACAAAERSGGPTAAARRCVSEGRVWFLLDIGRGRLGWGDASRIDPAFAAAAAPPATVAPRRTGRDIPRGALTFRYRCTGGERLDLVVAPDAQTAVLTTRNGTRFDLVRIRGSEEPLGYRLPRNAGVTLLGDARRIIWADGSGSRVVCTPR